MIAVDEYLLRVPSSVDDVDGLPDDTLGLTYLRHWGPVSTISLGDGAGRLSRLLARLDPSRRTPTPVRPCHWLPEAAVKSGHHGPTLVSERDAFSELALRFRWLTALHTLALQAGGRCFSHEPARLGGFE